MLGIWGGGIPGREESEGWIGMEGPTEMGAIVVGSVIASLPWVGHGHREAEAAVAVHG
jgi:hypothetical protein